MGNDRRRSGEDMINGEKAYRSDGDKLWWLWEVVMTSDEVYVVMKMMVSDWWVVKVQVRNAHTPWQTDRRIKIG